MADIDVERKKHGSIWPWILGLLLLALLVWALFALFGDDEPEVVQDPIAAPVATPAPAAPADSGVPPAVSTFLAQCTEAQGSPQGQMGLGHDFTVQCLQQLREAINSLTTRQEVADTNVSQRLDEYTSTVQELQQSDTTAATHANLTRDAASTAVEAIQAIQTAWFSGNQQIETAVGELQQSVEGIQPSVAMLEQRDSVRTFFREAGEVLRMMAVQAPAAAPL